jgi:ElaB/YqjD/DUF883 family membrane-anchored ribosome-binding protein
MLDLGQIRHGAGGYHENARHQISMENGMEHATSEKLMQDMRVVVQDAEELLKATAGQTGERIEKIRVKAEDSLRSARQRLQQAGNAVQEGARDAAKNVNEHVYKNPWTAIGVGAGIGLVVGILIGRR